MDVNKLTFTIKDVLAIIVVAFSLGCGFAKFDKVFDRLDDIEKTNKKQHRELEYLLYLHKNELDGTIKQMN